MFNVANQEVESIYQAIYSGGEKLDEQLLKKRQRLEAVEKELTLLQEKRSKLQQEIKALEHNLNASKHSNMVGELESYGIDLEDKETLQTAIKLIIQNMGQDKKNTEGKTDPKVAGIDDNIDC